MLPFIVLLPFSMVLPHTPSCCTVTHYFLCDSHSLDWNKKCGCSRVLNGLIVTKKGEKKFIFTFHNLFLFLISIHTMLFLSELCAFLTTYSNFMVGFNYYSYNKLPTNLIYKLCYSIQALFCHFVVLSVFISSLY